MNKKSRDTKESVITPEAPAEARIGAIVHHLRQAHPDARCALIHNDPLQLLVATILSAQCTDERVNMVAPALFKRFPTAEAFAQADRGELEEMIRSTGFYRQKAKYIQLACRQIVANHNGRVPQDMEDLLKLAGVARKTANVVLGVAFQKAEGVVVDTHVKRISGRLGLTRAATPEKIEKDLMALLPREDWIDFSHLLIFHGRRVCKARKPDCPQCVLRDLCPSAGINERGQRR